jgi:CheY-like chemotaxis protein
MDEERMQHMFEPFFENTFEGRSAMAMAVTYSLIMQYGGWIEVTSVPGRGSSYAIYLPLSHKLAVKKNAGFAAFDDLAGRGERILLVEDEAAVRSTIERMLRDNGYEVLTAADASQAFDIFVSSKGNIELVFSDVVLPGESGVELVELLRSHSKRLPVILSSGYTDRAADLDIIREKNYRFLQKPFSLPELLKTVRELLEASSAASLV